MKQVRHQFLASDYYASRQDYSRNWKTVDQTLYGLCQSHPWHRNLRSVMAKIAIIGRTYTTGIERKVSTTGAQGSSISQVAALFFSQHKKIDKLFARLNRVSSPLSTLNIPDILTIHGSILKLLMPLTINHQSARSFVSKYMHFQNPIVPIYDSVVAGFLPKLVRLRAAQIPTVKYADYEYSKYVYTFAKLYQDAASQRVQVSVRFLDYYLTWKKANS